MNRYFHQRPVALPVHTVRCTVFCSRSDVEKAPTFTVARFRVAELISLLVNVDFDKLVLHPVTFELQSTSDLLSLDAPFSPVDLAADTSDSVPYVSMWNTEDDHVRLVTPSRRYFPMTTVIVKSSSDGQQEELEVQRSSLAAKLTEVVNSCHFEEIVVCTKMPLQDGLSGQFSDLFDAIDLDHSGEIVLEELRIVLSKKGYSDDFVEHIFCHLDMNKDCVIKREEFYEALKFIPIDIFWSDRVLSDDHLLRYFDDFDAEHTGEVSWSQFHDALLKRGLSENFIKTYFAQLDLDNSNGITRDEYKRCIGLRWKTG